MQKDMRVKSAGWGRAGFHLGWGQMDWIELAAAIRATGARNLLILAGNDLPARSIPNMRIVYRPRAHVKAVTQFDPWEYAYYHRWEWEQKGAGHFDDLIYANEPNLPEEAGTDDPQIIAEWCRVAAIAMRAAFPGKRIHSPALSPAVPGYIEFYSQMAPAIRECNVVGIHDYIDCRANLEAIHHMYPDRPLFISECGRPDAGNPNYAYELIDYWADLPPYIEGACAFIWNTPHGSFDGWRLQNSNAVREMLALD